MSYINGTHLLPTIAFWLLVVIASIARLWWLFMRDSGQHASGYHPTLSDGLLGVSETRLDDITEQMTVLDRRDYMEAHERLVHTAELDLSPEAEWVREWNKLTPVQQWAEIAKLGIAEWLPAKEGK